MQVVGFRVQDEGFRVQGAGCRARELGSNEVFDGELGATRCEVVAERLPPPH